MKDFINDSISPEVSFFFFKHSGLNELKDTCSRTEHSGCNSNINFNDSTSEELLNQRVSLRLANYMYHDSLSLWYMLYLNCVNVTCIF